MEKEKFGTRHREYVVAELEKLWSTTLQPIWGLRKLFTDDSGVKFLVCGGRDDWHGLPTKVIKRESEIGSNDRIIVVWLRPESEKMAVYEGGLLEVLKNKNRLSLGADGQYTFVFGLCGRKLEIKNTRCRLEPLVTLPWTGLEQERAELRIEAKRKIARLTTEQKEDLLAKLQAEVVAHK